jgi:hypothetical protein
MSEVKIPHEPEAAAIDVNQQEKSSLKQDQSSGFEKIKVFIIALIVGGLDIFGYISNWWFAVGSMGPLSNNKALVAVNGTWNPDPYNHDYVNLTTSVCNPSTQGQVPSHGLIMFLFIFCILGLCLSTLYYLIGSCVDAKKSFVAITWWLQLKTLKKYGGVGKDHFQKLEKASDLLLFVTQEVIFAVSLGYFTFSCTPLGTFDSWINLMQYAITVVNIFKRMFNYARKMEREQFYAVFLFFIQCPGLIITVVIGFTLAMVIVPLVRFFMFGLGAAFLKK